MCMETETFISQEALVKNMKRWDEMTWEDIKKEHRPLVDRTFEEDEGINYLPDMYSEDTIERAKLRSVEGLGDLVGIFREEQHQPSQPGDVSWTNFFWKRDKKSIIKKRLLEDSELKKAMGEFHDMYAGNIAGCLSVKYHTLVNNRNCASY